MKRMSIRKISIAAALIGTTGMAVAAFAHGGPGYGMWGYGPGYGMIGGYGHGMMSGHGPGYGMGPGMMGGYGMGPGMMWGYGSGGAALKLNDEQREKIGKIQDDTRRKQWELMGKMHEEQGKLYELGNADKRDDGAISKGYKKLSELRQQMFDNSLAAQKQVDGVLTKEQREQLRADGHCDWIN